MSLLGGRRLWERGAALLLCGMCAVTGLSGCEYADDGADSAPTPRASRAAPPSPLPTVPDLANVENRNFNDLDSLLGARPDNAALEGIGHLSGDGFRKSLQALAKGRYSVTAACAGSPKATLSISQNGLLDGGRLEMILDCGKATQAQVEIVTGPVQIHAFYPTSGPATGSVAGFWLVPAAGS